MPARTRAAAPDPVDGIAAALSGLISPRSVDDVFAERVRVRLGETEYVLPVLNIAEEEEWRRSFDAAWEAVLVSDDPLALNAAFEVFPVSGLLDALIAYDVTGVLPPRDEILRMTTKVGVLRAVLEVRQSVNPLAVIGLAAMMAGIRANGSSPASSSRRPSTAGRRGRSGRK